MTIRLHMKNLKYPYKLNKFSSSPSLSFFLPSTKYQLLFQNFLHHHQTSPPQQDCVALKNLKHSGVSELYTFHIQNAIGWL